MKKIKRKILNKKINKNYFTNIFNKEVSIINDIPKLPACEFHHIGSTSIQDNFGEEIVDILVVVNNLHEITSFDEKRLNYEGYHRVAHNKKGLISYIKITDYTSLDYSVKLYIVQKDSSLHKDFLFFQELLINNNLVFEKYVSFKQENIENKSDLKKYEKLKTIFIKKIIGEHYEHRK